MSKLKLFLLGAPCLERDGVALEFDTRKAIALLAYLALGGQGYSRDTLASLFWPEYNQSQARGSLRRTLSVLVKGIGPEQMEVDRETISLTRGNGLWVDVVQFRQLLAERCTHSHLPKEVCADCLPLLNQALALYRGDFMSGFNLRDSSEAFETWHLFQSESLRQEGANVLEKLVSGYVAQGELEPALAYARRWVALDPLDEVAQRQLMQVYAWAGQRNAALRQYQNLIRLLDEELGIPPDPETEALQRTIGENCLALPPVGQGSKGLVLRQAQDPNQEEDANLSSLLPGSRAPQHNLPAQTTHFIGRTSEVAELNRLLAEPTCRVLTLTGPGGVGKTRLAIELAFTQRDAFADGVCFVSLAPVSEVELIIPSVVEALNFNLSGANPPKLQLLNYLSRKQLLLVLDNMEQLLPRASDQDKAAIDLLADILHSAPAVKLLVTSRERLNLHGEWIFDVKGLSVPPIDQKDRLDTYEAALLFVQSARRTSASFELAAEEQPAVARICRLMEGWPLGIELAAAWTHLLSCAEIVHEIEYNLDFPATSIHNVPERQRSLRAAFDYSWNLLNEDERQTLVQLSVFRGGFTRQAAEQVTEASLAKLSALAEKSLLQRTSPERYSLHELLRQFVARRLQDIPQEEHAARKKHSHYYLTLLQTSESALNSSLQRETLAKLSADIDNIRTAWEVAVTHEQIDLLRRATRPLYYFYELHQYFREAEALFRRAAEMVRTRLTALGNSNPAPERAILEGALGDILNYQAFFNLRQGNNREASISFQANIALLQPLHETYALAFALLHYGVLCWASGDFDEASRNLHEGLSLSRALEQPHLQSLALGFLGGLTHDRGDYAEGYRWLSEAMEICRNMGDPYHTLFIGIYFSRTAQALGKLSEAHNLLREGLRIAQETNNRWGIGLALERMAVLAQADGNEAEARRLIEESIALQREVGDRWSLSWSLNVLSRLALTQLDIAEAERSALEVLKMATDAEYNTIALDALANLAAVRIQQGNYDAALELALHIVQHPAGTQETKDQARRMHADLTSHFGPHQVMAIEARAQGRTLEQIVTDLLTVQAAGQSLQIFSDYQGKNGSTEAGEATTLSFNAKVAAVPH